MTPLNTSHIARVQAKRKKQRDKYTKDLNTMAHAFQSAMKEALALQQQHVAAARESIGGGDDAGRADEYNGALLECVHLRYPPRVWMHTHTRGEQLPTAATADGF